MGLLDKLLKEVVTEENVDKAVDLLRNLKEGLENTVDTVSSEESKEKVASFLSDLKGKINEAAESINIEENKEALSSLFGGWKESLQNETTSEEHPEYYEELDDGKTCKEKILEVLSEEFGQYNVKEDVSPTTIGGTGRFMNYSLGVYDGDKPVLFIMIIGKTTTSHREYRWSKEEAEKQGITFLNFIRHYPHRKEYISERLHRYL